MHIPLRDKLLGSEGGSSLIEAAVFAPVLLMLMLGAADFGRGYYLAEEVAAAAHSGAEYAIQNPGRLSSDSTGIETAAKDDAPNVSGLSVATPAWGCECSDGSSFSAACASVPSSCSTNWVYKVTVTASVNYAPLFPWPGIPSSFALSSSATMRGGGNE
ncbi:MAG TPA: TadE/TadG family type IV pilus assembly protein [Acidobacteriaceae bacterium]|jgi:Flp pilus assembly protein TadG|nr:TadE/TadG family type IV pilus assembly protein [Acidobacteriaceae bacterium]